MSKTKATPITPVFDENRNRWRLSIPKKYSLSGKRERKYFKTKRQAGIEAERLKAMLEECRLSYVRRSLVREGKLISNGDSVDVDSCDTKRLVSSHSMRHVIQGTMTMQDLFDRSARSLIFSPYTSKSFSETHLVDVIVDTQIQQQHL